jgi:hypothetical protein
MGSCITSRRRLIKNQQVDISCALPARRGIRYKPKRGLVLPVTLYSTRAMAHLAAAGRRVLKWTFKPQWSSVSAVCDPEAASLWSTVTRRWPSAPNDDDVCLGESPALLESKGYRSLPAVSINPCRRTSQPRSPPTRRQLVELLLHAGAYPRVTTVEAVPAAGFKPKAATGGATIMYPSSIAALGEIGTNLMDHEVGTPTPLQGLLTGMTAAEMVSRLRSRRWEPVGYHYRLPESG